MESAAFDTFDKVYEPCGALLDPEYLRRSVIRI